MNSFFFLVWSLKFLAQNVSFGGCILILLSPCLNGNLTHPHSPSITIAEPLGKVSVGSLWNYRAVLKIPFFGSPSAEQSPAFPKVGAARRLFRWGGLAAGVISTCTL